MVVRIVGCVAEDDELVYGSISVYVSNKRVASISPIGLWTRRLSERCIVTRHRLLKRSRGRLWHAVRKVAEAEGISIPGKRQFTEAIGAVAGKVVKLVWEGRVGETVEVTLT